VADDVRPRQPPPSPPAPATNGPGRAGLSGTRVPHRPASVPVSGAPSAALDFAYEQSYGKVLDAGGLAHGGRAPRWPGPRWRLPTDALRPLAAVAPVESVAPVGPVEPGSLAAKPRWPGWLTVLAGAFGPTRFEANHPHRALLRAYPSPRAIFPTTAFVVGAC